MRHTQDLSRWLLIWCIWLELWVCLHSLHHDKLSCTAVKVATYYYDSLNAYAGISNKPNSLESLPRMLSGNQTISEAMRC